VYATVADSTPAVAAPTVGASGTSGIGVLPLLTLFNETLLMRVI
jgi:hypothetical protein